MSTVPLDLQRRCEQRWAARNQRPQEPAATPEHGFQKHDQLLAAPGRNKIKNRRVQPADLRWRRRRATGVEAENLQQDRSCDAEALRDACPPGARSNQDLDRFFG